VLKAVVDASPLLSIFIVFGSAATLFFWVKWMGKLVQVVGSRERVAKELVLGESIALYGLSAATFLTCLLFPLISSFFIKPYILAVYGNFADLGQGNVIIMTIMMALVLLFPLSLIGQGKGPKVVDAYLGGANVEGGERFRTIAGTVQDVSIGNYYLQNFFNEVQLSRWGVISCTMLLAAMFFLTAFL
jgi:ech hydrogenase subunit A